MKDKKYQLDIRKTIGKKWFLADDNTLAAKLIYLNGINEFDNVLNNKFQNDINAVIHLTEYPKGLLIKLAKYFTSTAFGLAYKDINTITIYDSVEYSNVVIKTENGNINFLIRRDDVKEFIRFIEKLNIKIQESGNSKEVNVTLLQKREAFLNNREIMTVEKVLFTFDGRINRKEFWIKGILILAPFNLALHSLSRADIINPFISIIITLILLFPTIAIYSKRLHDRNLSGNFSWLILSPLILFIKPDEINSMLLTILYIGFSIGFIWLLIQTWFLSGYKERNKYGTVR